MNKCSNCRYATNKDVILDPELIETRNPETSMPRCTNEKSKEFDFIVYGWKSCAQFEVDFSIL